MHSLETWRENSRTRRRPYRYLEHTTELEPVSESRPKKLANPYQMAVRFASFAGQLSNLSPEPPQSPRDLPHVTLDGLSEQKCLEGG